MKVPVKWLREYVDIAPPPAELAERLTMAGLEVKAVQVTGDNWGNIVVGQITAINPHPNADRLLLPTVNLGAESETVVCGAPNLKVGDKVPFARVGAQLIDPHSGQTIRLTPAKIRGVVSRGMVCSEKELGISDSHEGIMVLTPDAPVGMPLADYLGDAVLDLDITPNRPDCLSVIGVAREAAALYGRSLRLPETGYEETEPAIGGQISVEIADADLCSRYCASLVTGVKIAESPKWLQQRLQACGMRPINNVVDVTNYVMLEYGQPLHAFDYQKIRGEKIIVRRAGTGENIDTLDGVKRALSPDILVIADAERAVAIAGVMGGANSEVDEDTTSILLESANFNPANIYYTSRQLSLSSEASMRFERGIRPGLTMPALKRATQLLIQLADGRAARGVADVYPGKRDPQPILLSTDETKRILGTEFSLDRIADTLTSLGFECRKDAATGEVRATPPYWRNDISRAVDLAEEVARITGYDKIPSTLLGQPLPHQTPEPIHQLRQRLRQSLTGYGFYEAVTYSLVSMESLTRLTPEQDTPEPEPIRLANPMTADQEYLRPNLRANLLATLAANRRHEDGSIRLFELDKVYLPRGKELPGEPDVLCGIMCGARLEKSWLGGGEPVDFFDAKGIVEGILDRAGVAASFEPSSDRGLHPARQAAIVIEEDQQPVTLGVVGELHPKVLDAFEISEPVYLFEINVATLLPLTIDYKLFQPIPRFPGTVRDMALVVDAGVTHRQVKDIIRSFPLVNSVTIFDVYMGEQVPAGKKSLAYRVVYQSPAHTLTDEEVNDVQQQILDRLARELGAALRA